MTVIIFIIIRHCLLDIAGKLIIYHFNLRTAFIAPFDSIINLNWLNLKSFLYFNER